MVVPPYFSVPPDGYGGIELVVAHLVDGLVDRGHHVTLIGAGAHRTKAQDFVPASRLSADRLGEAVPEIVHAARVADVLEERSVDIVHDHTLAGPLLARGRLIPTVVTVHGPVSGEEGAYYRALGDTVRLVAISAAQRALAPHLPWVGTVHNSIDVTNFPYSSRKDPFALFLGRFHPHKAPHLAIDAARAAGIPLVLAGKCREPVERAYFNEWVLPRLGPDVTVFGTANETAKKDLLARAACLLFPICWEEPFGLVMIEAMACGTPVVAMRRGSVPEIVVDGVTGVICEQPADLAEGIVKARRLNSVDCRYRAETAFDVPLMTTNYEQIYRNELDVIRETPQKSGVYTLGPPSKQT